MKEDNSSSFFSKFYGRRSIRIFPLYYLYLVLMATILIVSNITGPAIERFFHQLPYAATYTYNLFHASSAYNHTPLLTHFWSLAVEEQFYLFWPLLLFFVPKKHIRIALLIFLFISPVLRFLFYNVFTNNTFSFILNKPDTVVYVLPTSHIDAFATGGLFALFIRSFKPMYTWLFLAALVILGLITNKLSLGYFYYTSLGYPPFMPNSYKYLWGYTLFNIAFAMILSNIRDNNFLPSIFKNNVLDYLGKISYGLYVYHYAVIYFVNKLNLEKPISVLVSIGITIVISAISFHFYENKILKWKDKLFPVKHHTT